MQWEYKRAYIRHGGGKREIDLPDQTLRESKVDDYLDLLGADGWELVSAFPVTMRGATIGEQLWFKRALQPQKVVPQEQQPSQAPPPGEQR